MAIGDLLALMAMLGWAGYTLLQNRVGSGVSFLARIGLFAAAGALFSLPFAIHEMWYAPPPRSAGVRRWSICSQGWSPAFLPIRPMPISARKFGAVSTSLSLYLGPIVSAVLSILFLGEAPTMIHLIGGALSLGGMWLSLQAKQGGHQPSCPKSIKASSRSMRASPISPEASLSFARSRRGRLRIDLTIRISYIIYLLYN